MLQGTIKQITQRTSSFSQELTNSKIGIYLKSYVCVVLGDQMSIVSSARKGNLSTRSGATNKSSRRSVRFQLNYNLKSVLTDFENEKKQQSYKELVCNIRDAGLEIRVSCPLFFYFRILNKQQTIIQLFNEFKIIFQL